MSKFLFSKKNFVVLQSKNGYIVYNKNKLWENGHTHVTSLKICRTLINLVLNQKIPNSNDIWLYESILRITSNSQKEYKRKIISKMDSIILDKLKNKIAKI